MTDPIDSLVKGAPLPGTKAVSGPTPVNSQKEGDPLHHTPSSPSMVYLNLLILEASLRAQYLELRARRRHHTFFLSILTVWIAGFGYALFLAPKEVGSGGSGGRGGGHGGPVYWGLEVAEQVCFMGGVITAALVWGTGIWDRGVKWPRRWFATSNRGLRGFNCKLVLLRRPWWAELGSSIGFFLTYGLFSHTASSSYRFVDPAILREVGRDLSIRGGGGGGGENNHGNSHLPLPVVVEHDEEKGGREEDLAPGGDYVKLLLLPKYFTANFRENWDLYRTEYWERENERRALLRQRLESKGRAYARQRWGVLWWLPWRRAEVQRHLGRERPRPAAPNQQHLQQHQRAAAAGEHTRHHRSGSIRRGSVGSSRSPTPTVEADDGVLVARRLSSASSGAPDKARRRLSATPRGHGRRESRSVTPDYASPLTPAAGDGKTVRKSPSGGSMRSIGSVKEVVGGEEAKEGGREKDEKGVGQDEVGKGVGQDEGEKGIGQHEGEKVNGRDEGEVVNGRDEQEHSPGT